MAEANNPPQYERPWRTTDQRPDQIHRDSPLGGEFWHDTDPRATVNTFRVRGWYRIIDGRLTITDLRIEPCPWIEDPEGALRPREPEDLPTEDLLRTIDEIPLGRYLRGLAEYLRRLPDQVELRFGSGPEVDRFRQAMSSEVRAAEEVRKRPGPKGHPPSELATWAKDCIEEAMNPARGHLQRLADRWFVAVETARDRVGRLREERWLEPGRRGKFIATAGEELRAWVEKEE